MRFVKSVGDVVFERTSEELIGAVFVAVVLGLVMAGLFALWRRKVSDATTLFVGLTLVANVACMTLAVGYVRYVETKDADSPKGAPPAWPPGGFASFATPVGNAPCGPWGATSGPWPSLGFLVVMATDADRDGRLTPDEIARFVQEADKHGKGSVDFNDIDTQIRRRHGAPPDPAGISPPPDVSREATPTPPGPGDAPTAGPAPAPGDAGEAGSPVVPGSPAP